MKISTEQYLSAWITGAMALAIGATLTVTSLRVGEGIARDRLVTASILAVAQLRLVTLEYVLSRNERPKAQWQRRHASLATLLAESAYDGTFGEGSMSHVRERHRQLKVVFADLVQNRESDASSAGELAQSHRLDALLVGDLLDLTQDMLADLSRMGSASDADLASAKRQENLLLAAIVALLGAMMAVQLRFTRARILIPIARLERGAAAVGAGDLEFRTGIASDDEIGGLSRAFDRMVSETQKSRADIERKSAQLAVANKELDAFAYVASHDLQEPLRMVIGHVQLVEKRLAGQLDADTREFMAYAVDGALRMRALIEDILAYSRIGTRERTLVPVDCGGALNEALALLAGRIAETGAEVDAGPLPTLTADRRQLVQLFQNLIGNALKFCKDGAPRVRVEAREQDRCWRFSVTDNGIGIEAQYRERIFGVFQRLHTRGEFPGTGIGLAICKRIIERHGGEIGVEPAPGGGSVFWFTLPKETIK